MKFYARLTDFKCADCGDRFIAAEVNHCSFHPMTPKFSYGLNQGYYPCCSSQAVRFNTSIKKNGCTSKNHVPHSSSGVFELLMKHQTEICEPYEFEKENPATGTVEIIKKLSDQVDSNKSLLKLTKMFLSGKHNLEGDVHDEDEDQAEAGDGDDDDAEVVEGGSNSDGENAREAAVVEQLNSELQAQQMLTADFLRAKKNKKQQKFKDWRMDMLRMDDLTQMRLMQKELSKMRKAKDK